jgi:hypothetical protein
MENKFSHEALADVNKVIASAGEIAVRQPGAIEPDQITRTDPALEPPGPPYIAAMANIRSNVYTHPKTGQQFVSLQGAGRVMIQARRNRIVIDADSDTDQLTPEIEE